MKKFDLIVIGAGSGLDVASAAHSKGWKVALVEKGPMGGTCLNRGCIPSKMVIHSADVAEQIRNAGKFGIKVKGFEVDFGSITRRASKEVDGDAAGIEKAIRSARNYSLYKNEGKFTGPKTLKVGDEEITSDKIVIAGGTRPAIPKIPGLESVEYMTSTEALRLTEQPKSMVIIGGGYIAAELAHFYGALGTKITIIETASRLLSSADAEISGKFTEVFGKKYDLLLEHTVQKVSKEGKLIAVTAQKIGGKGEVVVKAEKLLIAAGRVPNTDILDVAKAGIKVNPRGFIETNDFLETNIPDIWAFGDIAGKYQFKHSANHEGGYVTDYLLSLGNKKPVEYGAMPWAVFSSPQVAGAGNTEEQLKAESVEYAIGKYEYKNTGMGSALLEEDGFVKVLVDRTSNKILGCFIIGPEASTLIHEVVVAMMSGDGTVENVWKSIHAHPALSEVVQRAFYSIEW